MNCRSLPTASDQPKQKGYTLIELLLYIVMLSLLLGSISLYFGVVMTSRVKTQSISEVEQQGALLMSQLVQTVRNANSINAPYPAASANRLTLGVPTVSLDPTIFNLTGSTSAVIGYNSVGTITDSANSNSINATKFVASTSGTVATLYARVGASVGASPNNKAQMAIYSGTSNPTTLLANSGDVVITASSWVAFPIPAVSVTSGTTYWLAYNTNGTTISVNNLVYHAGTTNQLQFTGQTYGTWPSSYSGTSQSYEFSVYALIENNTSTGAMQMKEGSSSAVSLTNSKVQLSGLTFTNLSRSGTSGVVRISFTLSRISNSTQNQYDYQKTFIASVAVRRPP